MSNFSCYDGPSHLGRQAMHQAAFPARSYRFGLFEADVVQKTLLRNGLRVKIQDQPFRVLILLLERPGEVVARDELRTSIWPEGTFVDFDGSLNVILKKLRAAIDDNPENPRFIETIPRRGYRFIAPVIVHREEAEARSRRTVSLAAFAKNPLNPRTRLPTRFPIPLAASAQSTGLPKSSAVCSCFHRPRRSCHGNSVDALERT